MLPGSRRRYTHNSRSGQTAFVAVILPSCPPESLHRGTVTSDKLQLVVRAIYDSTVEASRQAEAYRTSRYQPLEYADRNRVPTSVGLFLARAGTHIQRKNPN